MGLLQQFESEVASQAINTLQAAVEFETGNEAKKYDSLRHTIAFTHSDSGLEDRGLPPHSHSNSREQPSLNLGARR